MATAPSAVATELYVPSDEVIQRMAREDMRARLANVPDAAVLTDDERTRQLSRSKMRILMYFVSAAERDLALWQRIMRQQKERTEEMDVRYGPLSEYPEQVKEDYWQRHRVEDTDMCRTFEKRIVDTGAACSKLRQMHTAFASEMPGRKSKKPRKILRLDLTLEEEDAGAAAWDFSGKV